MRTMTFLFFHDLTNCIFRILGNHWHLVVWIFWKFWHKTRLWAREKSNCNNYTKVPICLDRVVYLSTWPHRPGSCPIPGRKWFWEAYYVTCARYNLQGLCHTLALPFTLKSILRQKKNYENFKYFSMQKYNLQKINPLKETKNPSRYHNSITNLKFLTQDKISFFKKKSSYKNRPTTT